MNYLACRTSDSEWSSVRMTPGQVELILSDLGIQIANESDTHYSVFCPFHGNSTTTAATVSKESGFFYCFNGACGKQLKLLEFIKKIKHWDTMRTMRYIEGHKTKEVPLTERIKEKYVKRNELPSFDLDILHAMQEEYWNSEEAQAYLAGRGINEYSAKHFGIGYDPGRGMILTPMFSTDGDCVGVIGRSIVGKDFKNSFGLPTKTTLFNINNAKRQGSDTLILTESNFDAIRVHQSGHPNVCATLGGTFSDYHVTQIYRSFSNLLLMTDDDEPGIAFGKKITAKARKFGLTVYRGRFDEFNLFPRGAKDACSEGVSDREISHCVINASIVP